MCERNTSSAADRLDGPSSGKRHLGIFLTQFARDDQPNGERQRASAFRAQLHRRAGSFRRCGERSRAERPWYTGEGGTSVERVRRGWDMANNLCTESTRFCGSRNETLQSCNPDGGVRERLAALNKNRALAYLFCRSKPAREPQRGDRRRILVEERSRSKNIHSVYDFRAHTAYSRALCRPKTIPAGLRFACSTCNDRAELRSDLAW